MPTPKLKPNQRVRDNARHHSILATFVRFCLICHKLKATALNDFLGLFQTRTRGRWDWATPLAIIGLASIGIFFIYSAQFSSMLVAPPHESLYTWVRRSYWARS